MLHFKFAIKPILFILFFMTGYVIIAQESSGIANPKQNKFTVAKVSVGSLSRVIAPEEFRNAFKASINSFNNKLSKFSASKKNLPVSIEISRKDAPDHQEGYAIEIKNSSIRVTGSDLLGALHGMTTLEQLIANYSGFIPQGQIIDWPDHKIRALHLVLRSVDPSNIKHIIREARYGHYNYLILNIADGIQLSSMKGLYREDAWSKDQFMDVIKEARQNGLDIIPEIKLLTHQEKLFKNAFPHLMYNKSTYDPRKEEVYVKVYQIIDEVIDLVKPKAFHIGHDEVAGHNKKSKEKWLKKNESMLPSDLFLKDVIKLHSYLKEKKVETWMWGDMLIAPEEFPGMNNIYLHGTNSYSNLRSKVPKGVVICDWHYVDEHPDFPSALSFAKAGYKVLGATWKKEITIKNFSKYVANMNYNDEGMIATTWYHVQRKEWDIVNNIIRTSAEAFWNAK